MRLVYLDECGFSPSQPVTSTWVRRGQRKHVPYENPQGRRVNALAALDKHGASPALYWVAKSGTFTAEHLLCFLHALPHVSVPTVVVLDNASIHRSKVVRAALPRLWAAGLYPFYLPPYSPELNDIEPIFRPIKHHQLPQRRYTTTAALLAAVDAAFTAYAQHRFTKYAHQPGIAA